MSESAWFLIAVTALLVAVLVLSARLLRPEPTLSELTDAIAANLSAFAEVLGRRLLPAVLLAAAALEEFVVACQEEKREPG